MRRAVRVWLLSLVAYLGAAALSQAANDLADHWGSTHVPEHSFVLDITHHYLGTPLMELAEIPEALVLVLSLLMLAVVFYEPGADSSGRRTYWDAVLTRFTLWLWTHGLVVLMRTTTVLATIMFKSPRCGKRVAASGVFNSNCYDMVFSGHVAMKVLATAFIASSRLPLPLRVLGAVLGPGGCVAVLLAGDHYTVDALVATYISVLVFLLFRGRFLRSYLPATESSQAATASAKIKAQ